MNRARAFSVGRIRAAVWCTAVATAALCGATGQAEAQQDGGVRNQTLVTRAELEAYAARVEQEVASGGGEEKRAEAAALRERLREGDFKVGDKIILSTTTTFGLPDEMLRLLNDTVTVRDGRVIRLPNMSDLSLQGVLRSELESTLNTHVARYVRNVELRAIPLVQVLVSGPVGMPGYLYLAPDMLVADVLNRAGPSSAADLTKSEVKRVGKVVVKRDSLQAAIRAGATLDRTLQSGDELAVAERAPKRNWMTYVGVVSGLASLGYLILRIAGK